MGWRGWLERVVGWRAGGLVVVVVAGVLVSWGLIGGWRTGGGGCAGVLVC